MAQSTPKQRAELVEQVILQLGLKDAADTIIGDDFRRGCSGGEKRRTSIGVQLLANKNVARCWAYETSLALQLNLPPDIPETMPSEFRSKFGPTFELHPNLRTTVPNGNSAKYLERIRGICLDQLKWMRGAPSVEFSERYGGDWRDEDIDQAMEEEEEDSQRGMERSWEGNGARSENGMKDGSFGNSFEEEVVGKGLDAIVNV